MHLERQSLKKFVDKTFNSVQDFADLFGLSHSSIYSKFYNKETPFKLAEKKDILEIVGGYMLSEYGNTIEEKDVFGTTGNVSIKTKGNNNTIAGGDINLSDLKVKALEEKLAEKEKTIKLQNELIQSLKQQLKLKPHPLG